MDNQQLKLQTRKKILNHKPHLLLQAFSDKLQQLHRHLLRVPRVLQLGIKRKMNQNLAYLLNLLKANQQPQQLILRNQQLRLVLFFLYQVLLLYQHNQLLKRKMKKNRRANYHLLVYSLLLTNQVKENHLLQELVFPLPVFFKLKIRNLKRSKLRQARKKRKIKKSFLL